MALTVEFYEHNGTQFEVEFQRGSNGEIALSGRCYSGPISVGSRFLYLIKLQWVRDDPSNPYLIKTNIILIDMTVVGVEAYHKRIDAIYSPMTGRLFVTGVGVELIERGDVVSNIK